MIWATTQHYVDFESQIQAVRGSSITDPDQFRTARATLAAIFMNGLAPDGTDV